MGVDPPPLPLPLLHSYGKSSNHLRLTSFISLRMSSSLKTAVVFFFFEPESEECIFFICRTMLLGVEKVALHTKQLLRRPFSVLQSCLRRFELVENSFSHNSHLWLKVGCSQYDLIFQRIQNYRETEDSHVSTMLYLLFQNYYAMMLSTWLNIPPNCFLQPPKGPRIYFKWEKSA